MQDTHAAAKQDLGNSKVECNQVASDLETAQQSMLQLTEQLNTSRGEVSGLSGSLAAAQVNAAVACLPSADKPVLPWLCEPE